MMNFSTVMRGLAKQRGIENVFDIIPQVHHEGFAKKSYEDTEYQQILTVNAESMGYTFPPNDDRPDRIAKVIFAGISVYLSRRKVSKPDEAVAWILQDMSGGFKFAAIVEYHINEANPDEPGNWSYTMTFNEEDIIELEKKKTLRKFLAGDEVFKSTLDKTAYDVGGFTFGRETFMYNSCLLTVDTILQVLDHEAVEGQVVDIEIPGYVTASVSIQNGEKVFAIVPSGQMKQLIKSDIALDD